MTATLERPTDRSAAGAALSARWSGIGLLAAAAADAVAAWAVIERLGSGGTAAGVIRRLLALAWALTATFLAVRRASEPLALLVAAGAAVAGVGSLGGNQAA